MPLCDRRARTRSCEGRAMTGFIASMLRFRAARRRARRRRSSSSASRSCARRRSTSCPSSRRPTSRSRPRRSASRPRRSSSSSPSRSSRTCSTASRASTRSARSSVPGPVLDRRCSSSAGTDILHARQLVQERLTQAARAPERLAAAADAAAAVLDEPRDDDRRSRRRSSVADRALGARALDVRPRLMGVAGVANVAIWGQRDRQLQVLSTPRACATSDVTLEQVIATAGNAQLVSPLSFLEASTPGHRRLHRRPQPAPRRPPRPAVRDAGRPRAGPASRAPARAVRLGDVADVVEDHQPLIGDAVGRRRAGRPACSSSRSSRARTRSSVTRRRRGRARRAAARPRRRADRHVASSGPASFIESALDHLTLALIIAAALVAARAGRVPPAVARRRARASSRSRCRSSRRSLVLDLTGATINALVVAGLARRARRARRRRGRRRRRTSARALRERARVGRRAARPRGIVARVHAPRRAAPMGYATLIAAAR